MITELGLQKIEPTKINEQATTSSQTENNSIFSANINSSMPPPIFGPLEIVTTQKMSDIQLEDKLAEIKIDRENATKQSPESSTQYSSFIKNIESEINFRKYNKMFNGNAIGAKEMVNLENLKSDYASTLQTITQKRELLKMQLEEAQGQNFELAAQYQMLDQKMAREQTTMVNQISLLGQQSKEIISLYTKEPFQFQIDNVQITVGTEDISQNSEYKDLTDKQLGDKAKSIENSIKNDNSTDGSLVIARAKLLTNVKYEQNIRKYTEEFNGNKTEATRVANIEKQLSETQLEIQQINKKLATLQYQKDGMDPKQLPEVLPQLTLLRNNCINDKIMSFAKVNNLKAQKASVIQKNTPSKPVPSQNKNIVAQLMQLIMILIQMLMGGRQNRPFYQ